MISLEKKERENISRFEKKNIIKGEFPNARFEKTRFEKGRFKKDENDENDENAGIKKLDFKNENKLLGQGSYGCVYYPGITCSGKLNKKNYVTKLQEITFYSYNEIAIGKYIKKNVPNYKLLFAPIIKQCSVSFQTIQNSKLNFIECDTLFFDSNKRNDEKYGEKYGENKTDTLILKNFLKEKLYTRYFLMYMNFIVNKTVKNYFHNYENLDKFVVDIIRVFITLINSIGVLINNKIIHNDLHVNNILINLKNQKPVVIDFGLGLMFSKLYNKRDNTFDFKYLRNLIFDFRDDQYHVILEKRFLSFIIYNKSEYYNINITNQYEKNELTKYIIDIFINDAYDSISNQSIIFLSKIELAEYLKSLKQFYYQFLNKYKYPDYASIVSYLITFIIKYTDLYSLVFDIYYIYSTKPINSETVNSETYDTETYDTETYHTETFDPETLDPETLDPETLDPETLHPQTFDHKTLKSGSKLFFDFFLLLCKKILHPNPLMRLQYSEINNIYHYIIQAIIKYNNRISYNEFMLDFQTFLVSQSIKPRVVFNKNFAYLDFKTILNDDVFHFVKQFF